MLLFMLFWLAAIALFGPPEAIALRVTMGVLALAFALLLTPHVREMTKPDPMLTIGPDGIYFEPLNTAPAPWDVVSAIKVINNKKRRYVVFDVSDTTRANVKQGFTGQMLAMGRSMNDGYPIYNVAASTDEIIAALKQFWPGEIQELEAYGFTYRRKEPGAPSSSCVKGFLRHPAALFIER